MPKTDHPTLSFKTTAAMETWLEKNHGTSAGIWLRIFKKASGKSSVTYDEALDAALCFGWIDGLKHAHDAESWLQKFTPRTKRSGWSKRNTEHIARLMKAKRMRSAGIAAVEAAKKDGRWDRAYDAASSSTIPEDFLKELRKNKKAKAFFDTLNKANLYAISYRLQTAKKPETRERRMQAILAMLAEEKKFH